MPTKHRAAIQQMAEIIQFPHKSKEDRSGLEAVIDNALKRVPAKDRERLKFELIKTIDSYEGLFTTWKLTIPENANEDFKKEIYDLAMREHASKMRMLADIIRLKIEVLVNEYYRRP